MRLIDADAVQQEFLEYEFDGKWRGCTIKDLLDSQPTVHPEPHWIPVTERLPEENGEYLCQEKQGFLYVDEWNGEYWECADSALGIVTAWMPLPEPYKGVTE